MKIRGLPVELRPGPVELEVSGIECALLQPCLFCKEHNRIYLICRQSHVICQECFLPGPSASKLVQKQYVGYCRYCAEQTVMHRFEIPIPLLSNLKFQCGCGFAGRLSEIKKHVKSDEFSMLCSQTDEDPPPTSEKFDKNFGKLQKELVGFKEEIATKIKTCRELFGEALDDRLTGAPPGSYCFSKRVANEFSLHLAMLQSRLRQLRAETVVMKQRNVKIASFVERRFEELFGRERIPTDPPREVSEAQERQPEELSNAQQLPPREIGGARENM